MVIKIGGKNQAEISQDRLKRLLSYDQESGVFAWNESRANIKAGAVAGCVGIEGYIQISIDKRMYLAHRLAWLYVNGEWPDQMLDHINGNRSDNRIANLRLSNNSLNQQNTKLSVRNTSGYRGVHPLKHKKVPRWAARITVNGEKISLGEFDSPEEAFSVYVEAAKKYHKHTTVGASNE